MTAQLVRVLGVCFVALVVLFVARIVALMWQSFGVARLSDVDQQARAHPAQPDEPPCLVVRLPEDDRGRRHDLGGDVTIGRDASCDITVDDGYSSQVHARLFSQDGLHHLEDLGSTNGTYVNRQRVQTATTVRRGDQIQIGATVFEVRS